MDQNKHVKGRVRDTKAKAIIDKAQANKEGLDKTSRLTSEKFNLVFTEQKEIIYELRNKILEASNVDFIKYIGTIMSKYIISTVNYEPYEKIESAFGSFIEVKDCYSTNNKEFQDNLYKAIHGKFRSNFGAKITDIELNKYVKDMKEKFIDIIDDYWTSYFDILDLLKKKMTVSVTDDVFKLDEREANQIFGHEVYPGILNEMIAYAINPSMKYGEYEPVHKNDIEELSKIII